MLLRSSSTSMLGSLLPSLSHTEFALAEENEILGEIMAKGVSLRKTSSNSGSLTSCQRNSQSLLAGDPPLGEEAGWGLVDGEANMVWSTRVRKVQSESDLCNLGGSSTSARVAANTLLCNDKIINPSSDGGKEASSNVRKTWPKPLSRHRSLSSIPSVCFRASGLDRQDFIPEEVESASLTTSEEGESRVSIFDKIGLPIEETALDSASPDASSELVNQGLTQVSSSRVLEVIGGQVGVKERGWPTHVLQARVTATFSGRQELARAKSISSLLTEREMVSHLNSSTNMQAASETKLLDGGGGDTAFGGGGGGGGGGAGVRPPAITGGGGGGGGGGSDLTDLHYQKMLKENPGHPLLLRNYARYLAEVKRDYCKAEEFFQRAILANPSDGELLGQYAKIIWDVHQDRERAASYFERAVQAAPDDSYVVAAYASFLWNSEEEDDVAEEGSGATNFPSLPTLVSAGPA